VNWTQWRKQSRRRRGDKTEFPNAKEMFKEISDAAVECAGIIEYYEDEEPIPLEVGRAMGRVQEEVSNLASAFVLYMAIAKLNLR
jgi:hypothetical protein